jgi:hypothetical protein
VENEKYSNLPHIASSDESHEKDSFGVPGQQPVDILMFATSLSPGAIAAAHSAIMQDGCSRADLAVAFGVAPITIDRAFRRLKLVYNNIRRKDFIDSLLQQILPCTSIIEVNKTVQNRP